MHQTKTVSMTEGGVLAAIAVVFAMISAYIPVLGSFVNLIWPVPIILLGVRHGYRWSIMATVVSGVIIAITMHPLHAVTVVVGFGLIGIALGHAFRMDAGPFKSMLWGSIASLISKIAVFYIAFLVMGVNPLTTQVSAMSEAVNQAVAIYRNFGMKEAELTKLADTMNALVGYMKIIFPAGLILASVVDTYLNFVIARKVLKKLGHHVKSFPPFKLWSIPAYVAYAFFLSVVLTFWGNAQQLTMVYRVGLNLQVILSIFLLIQGLALFYFLADKYNLSRITRSIILVLVFTNGLFLQILVLSGAFDIAFDYRRLRYPRS
ncbi:Hypothetical protein LUCI_2775 [Lucifera butyrica]|uniref:DUF2232 domain-containing protein n=1 Tax=Lucifera butyrica TaxID=1351585 RepID=A0A498R4B1_9FIRM|nr:YybS family protein [Lucifera butyrica]VBB07526.1 Hypothetical protein LUCI_2775 [Lucifera butyrica]